MCDPGEWGCWGQSRPQRDFSEHHGPSFKTLERPNLGVRSVLWSRQPCSRPAIVANMFRALKNRMNEQMENLHRETGTIKENQMQILEFKSVISEPKNPQQL